MLAKQIWFYISNRVDNDGVLPSQDEIYIAFVYHFEALGWNPDIIAEQVERYCDCSDLTGVKIEWEGEISWKPYSGSSKIEIIMPTNLKQIS
jgi:hypothetical protein